MFTSMLNPKELSALRIKLTNEIKNKIYPCENFKDYLDKRFIHKTFWNMLMKSSDAVLYNDFFLYVLNQFPPEAALTLLAGQKDFPYIIPIFYMKDPVIIKNYAKIIWLLCSELYDTNPISRLKETIPKLFYLPSLFSIIFNLLENVEKNIEKQLDLFFNAFQFSWVKSAKPPLYLELLTNVDFFKQILKTENPNVFKAYVKMMRQCTDDQKAHELIHILYLSSSIEYRVQNPLIKKMICEISQDEKVSSTTVLLRILGSPTDEKALVQKPVAPAEVSKPFLSMDMGCYVAKLKNEANLPEEKKRASP